MKEAIVRPTSTRGSSVEVKSNALKAIMSPHIIEMKRELVKLYF